MLFELVIDWVMILLFFSEIDDSSNRVHRVQSDIWRKRIYHSFLAAISIQRRSEILTSLCRERSREIQRGLPGSDTAVVSSWEACSGREVVILGGVIVVVSVWEVCPRSGVFINGVGGRRGAERWRDELIWNLADPLEGRISFFFPELYLSMELFWCLLVQYQFFLNLNNPLKVLNKHPTLMH